MSTTPCKNIVPINWGDTQRAETMPVQERFWGQTFRKALWKVVLGRPLLRPSFDVAVTKQ